MMSAQSIDKSDVDVFKEEKPAGEDADLARLGGDVIDSEFDLLILIIVREPHHVLWDQDQ